MECNEHVMVTVEELPEISGKRYFVLMGLAATLLPAVIVSLPIIFISCFSLAFFVSVPVLIGLFYFAVWMYKSALPRFHAAVIEDRIPKNGLVLYLPIFLPFIYALIVTACGFSEAWKDNDARVTFFLWALPHYILITVPASLMVIFWGGGIEILTVVPLWANGIAAGAVTCYLQYFSPRRKLHIPTITGLCLASAALGIYCVCIHSSLRGGTLGRDPDVVTVSDETNLRPYNPFSSDNKLVSIDGEVDLHIDSEHPRLHGALALYPVYAAAVQEIYKNVGEKEAAELVKGGTSPAAFSALIEDEADMVFMLRPSEAQFKQAEAAGKTLAVTPIGREAFVFFVSTANPVENLSSEEIRDIYSKRTTRWNELGGKNERILPFQRPEGSGSQTAMERFMGERPLARPIKEEYQEFMGGIVNRVADYRNYGNSIGYSFRYYVVGMFKHEGVKLISVDGIAPSLENIQNGTYPLVGEMVIVTAGSENPNIARLTEWFLSPQGQQLIEKVGYVPLQ